MKFSFYHCVFILVAYLGLLTSCHSSEAGNTQSSEPPIKMILDLDTGIDDAMALAYAVSFPEVDLLGVVGSYGNVTVDQGVQNVLDLLYLLGRPEIPVYAGSSHALHSNGAYQPDEITQAFHGHNGLGDVALPTSPQKAQKEDGVDFLIKKVREYPKQLTIVAVGPLTNLAKAMEKDPTFEENVRRIVIMGGAVMLRGNVSHAAEANIYNDPIAARRVLRSKAKVTLVGLDVTHRTILTYNETAQWRNLQTPLGKAYADIVDYYIHTSSIYESEINGCALHDPLAVSVAINPQLVTTFKLNMDVSTDQDDYGRTYGDNARLLDENPNVSVCINVDHKAFTDLFFEKLYHLFQTEK